MRLLGSFSIAKKADGSMLTCYPQSKNLIPGVRTEEIMEAMN